MRWPRAGQGYNVVAINDSGLQADLTNTTVSGVTTINAGGGMNSVVP